MAHLKVPTTGRLNGRGRIPRTRWPPCGSIRKGLMGSAVGGVAGCASQPNNVLFVGVGSDNAAGWICKGGTRSKSARMLPTASLLCCLKRGN